MGTFILKFAFQSSREYGNTASQALFPMGPFSKPYRVCHSLPQILSVVQSFSKSLQGNQATRQMHRKSLCKIFKKTPQNAGMWEMAKCNSKIVWGAKNSWMEYNGASFHRANVNNQPLQMELAVHDFTRLRLVHHWTTRHQRQPQATKRLGTLISFGLGGSRVDSWPNVTGKWLLKCNYADALRYSIYFWNLIQACNSLQILLLISGF